MLRTSSLRGLKFCDLCAKAANPCGVVAELPVPIFSTMNAISLDFGAAGRVPAQWPLALQEHHGPQTSWSNGQKNALHKRLFVYDQIEREAQSMGSRNGPYHDKPIKVRLDAAAVALEQKNKDTSLDQAMKEPAHGQDDFTGMVLAADKRQTIIAHHDLFELEKLSATKPAAAVAADHLEHHQRQQKDPSEVSSRTSPNHALRSYRARRAWCVRQHVAGLTHDVRGLVVRVRGDDIPTSATGSANLFGTCAEDATTMKSNDTVYSGRPVSGGGH
jgi:hypothetical protein